MCFCFAVKQEEEERKTKRPALRVVVIAGFVVSLLCMQYAIST
jgi:hypothetical protein